MSAGLQLGVKSLHNGLGSSLVNDRAIEWGSEFRLEVLNMIDDPGDICVNVSSKFVVEAVDIILRSGKVHHVLIVEGV